MILGREEFEANLNCIVISSTARSPERDPTTHLDASWFRVQILSLLHSSWVIFVKLGNFSVLKSPKARKHHSAFLASGQLQKFAIQHGVVVLNENRREMLIHLNAQPPREPFGKV